MLIFEENFLCDPMMEKSKSKVAVILIFIFDRAGKMLLLVEDVQKFVQVRLFEMKSVEVYVAFVRSIW